MSYAEKLEFVAAILFFVLIAQSFRLATMRIKYKESLRELIAERTELIDVRKREIEANDLLDDASATIETATNIIADYQNGRLKPSYQYRLNDKDKLKTRIEWPETIEDKDK